MNESAASGFEKQARWLATTLKQARMNIASLLARDAERNRYRAALEEIARFDATSDPSGVALDHVLGIADKALDGR